MLSFDDGYGEALYVGGLFTNANGENYVARWRGLTGDIDGDGIVTGMDFTFNKDNAQGMKYCQRGPAFGAGGCECSDLNKDNHVDLRDVAELMNRMGSTD